MMGDFIFKIQHLNPKITSTATELINTQGMPIQNNIPKDEQVSITRSSDKNNIFVLKPQAEYILSGLVVAKNTNFFLRDVLYSDFDEICIMDLGIVWGEIATKQYVNRHLKFRSVKTLGFARQLQYRAKNYNTLPHEWSYISSHLSHTHIIPANSNVTKALVKIKPYDIVKLEGYLVDIYKENGETVALTSLSRFDENNTSRGYGACEDMLVTSVQIGNKIYK